MGRRRERGGFGRRQVLQLDDSRRDDSPYRGQGGGQWTQKNEANALSGLMAHYGESEESEEDEAPTPPHLLPPALLEADNDEMQETSEPSVPPKPHNENGLKLKTRNPTTDIDSKVANFLAEIDALDADSNDIDGEPLPETDQADTTDRDTTPSVPAQSPPPPDLAVNQSESESDDSGGMSGSDSEECPTAPTAPVSVWHHCQDENTQYYYYWNTETNEVTWEIPTEYSQYLLQIKEYEEATAKYEVQKTEFEERQKGKRKTKKKRRTHALKENSQLPVIDKPSEAEDTVHCTPAEKKPTKSWFLKKIRETYGDKYGIDDTDLTQEDHRNTPTTVSSYEIGPQLPHSAIGPQLPQDEMSAEPQPMEIGPQLPNQIETGPQQPQKEIGPQLPSQAFSLDEDPQKNSVATLIGPQLPKAAAFSSVPPPTDLYGPSDNGSETLPDNEQEKDSKTPDADSSGYGVTPSNSVLLGKCMSYDDTGIEADTTAENSNETSVPSNVGMNDEPLNFRKCTGSEDEDEEFDLDFIDKQLEETLDPKYNKSGKPQSGQSVVSPPKDSKVGQVQDDQSATSRTNTMSNNPVVESQTKSEAKGDDSDMEFDIDDIDQELEAALEKKKAEEVKTEKTAAVPKRKLSEETSGTADRTKKAKIPEEEKPPVVKKKMDKGEIKVKAEVADLATLIMDKLEFLDITRKGLSKLQTLLIQVETRVQDWRDGGLNTQFLLSRLEDAELQLQQYESSAAPAGWACHWDRTYKRYFYFHLTSGASQWDYPEEDGSKEVIRSDAHSTAAEAPPAPRNENTETSQVSSSQMDSDRDATNSNIGTSMPQCAQADSTTTNATESATSANTAVVSSVITSSISAKTEPTSSSMTEPGSTARPSSAFAVDPSLFQDLFAPAPPPPSEPPPPGVDASGGHSAPPRPPPGLAAALPLSRSPPPPPPGTTPPPSASEDIEMEIDPATSSLLAAAPPPPPPLDATTPANGYPPPAAPTPSTDPIQQYQIPAPPPVLPVPPVPPVIMAAPYMSHNTVTGMPLPVPAPPQVSGSASTIVAPPVISGVNQQNNGSISVVPAPPPPPHPPSSGISDTSPQTPVLYDPALDGVPMVDSSQQASSSCTSSSVSAAAAAAAQAKEKKRKKEKKSAMGLSLKKKKLPSLVAKWQEVQEAVEREASKHAKEEESP